MITLRQAVQATAAGMLAAALLELAQARPSPAPAPARRGAQLATPAQRSPGAP